MGKRLRDGFPYLHQDVTCSSPYIPSPDEHQPCERLIKNLPCTVPVADSVKNASNSVWKSPELVVSGGDSLSYGSEADIVHIVRNYLEDILTALNLPLTFKAEITIHRVRPDLCVLMLKMYLVGVIEIKKPGRTILAKPTVLGELFDQMVLVEGFFGMGPAIGILTTGEHWVVSWFPVDNDNIANLSSQQYTSSFSTPTKSVSSVGSIDESVRFSPVGGTPSQRTGSIHTIDALQDIEEEEEQQYDDNVEINTPVERRLCTTQTLSIYDDPEYVLQVLCSAFYMMALSQMNHRGGRHSQCLLKFHKNSKSVTFHPASHISIYELLDFDKFPTKSVKNLLAIEDLGRGSTGKAWLCATVTSQRASVCVLKFDNKDALNSSNLSYEHRMWKELYPEFANLVRVEMWSGAEALVMPHFACILEHERDQYIDDIQSLLIRRFKDLDKVHTDVKWRNIGKYLRKDGKTSVVLYDLRAVVDYNESEHKYWIENAIRNLSNGIFSSEIKMK